MSIIPSASISIARISLFPPAPTSAFMFLNRPFSNRMPYTQIQSPIGTSLWPIFRVMMYFSDFHSIGVQRSCLDVLTLNTASVPISSARRIHHLAVLPGNVESQSSHHLLIDLDLELHSIGSLQYDQSKSDERKLMFDSDEAGTCPAEEAKENERRKKIGLANKGKVPWNKGRPHSPETRVRIKQRTIEALRDPKVRRKMSESPRRHSDQVKAKISFSQRQLWEKRLKCKRAREKIHESWAENIAESARKGGVNEEELSWDSYDKMKRDIALRNLQLATEKAKERKITRAEKIMRTKEEASVKRPRKKNPKPKKVKEAPTLKARLTKIQRRKTTNGQISSQTPVIVSRYLSLERLDLQLLEREMMRKEVSLADEIRAAKSKRTLPTPSEALIRSSSSENGATGASR